MLLPVKLPDQDWLRRPEVAAIMAALGTARFVGGCVRNGLLGQPVDDIDIATPLTPDEVSRAVTARGMKAIDTGAEHGTLTVVAHAHPFEVTTLRRDVSTDGRRATVAFTREWREDAARRDFTINALYADLDGTVYDYHGGVADLQAGLVRFIGDADTRIAEDHLRILRLFRIHAWYGRGEIDAVALTASRAARQKIKFLSGERIQKEMLKLLRARAPVHALRAMRDTHVLEEVVAGDGDLETLSAMCQIDEAHAHAPDPVLRLVLLARNADVAAGIASRWRLSNDDRARLLGAFKLAGVLGTDVAVCDLGRVLYRHGARAIADQARLAWARSPASGRWAGLLDIVASWQRPQLPVDGADVMRAGVQQGPAVGKVLGAVEDWWVEAGFPDDRARVLQRLQDFIAQSIP